MSSDLALSVRGMSKIYQIRTSTDRSTLLAETLRNRLRRPLQRATKESFQALDDVSFDVERGEAVGVIGRNGAGKSTLLKILSRIVEPSAGRAELYGRLGSLLEVGTGFHPELTGRENIFLNGSLLGMRRRDVERQFDSITQFAQVDRFLETPVKRYSTGMYVRLAFAVAAHLSSDILVVDEVLSVGDAEFQRKCLDKMGEITQSGKRTVLFVSHNLTAVESFCGRGLHIESGRLVCDGPVATAVAHYLATAQPGTPHGVGVFDLASVPRRRGATPVFESLRVLSGAGTPTEHIRMGEALTFVVGVRDLAFPRRGVLLRILSGGNVPVVAVSTVMKPPTSAAPIEAQGELVFRIPSLPLTPGRYHVELRATEGGGGMRKVIPDHLEQAGSFDVLAADVYGSGYTLGSGGRGGGLTYVDMDWELRSRGAEAAGDGRVQFAPISPERQ